MARELKVNQPRNGAEYVDGDGDKLSIQIYSNGETVISIAAKGTPLDPASVMLSNKAAHQLRDLLNARFPNATAVQG